MKPADLRRGGSIPSEPVERGNLGAINDLVNLDVLSIQEAPQVIDIGDGEMHDKENDSSSSQNELEPFGEESGQSSTSDIPDNEDQIDIGTASSPISKKMATDKTIELSYNDLNMINILSSEKR